MVALVARFQAFNRPNVESKQSSYGPVGGLFGEGDVGRVEA